MAYFDCQIVQGGGGIILVVTCDPFYAGATITATDGETTLQATCPSSSPYTVEFKIPNSGSWTISGTASGETGTVIVVVPDSATLSPPIPTGSTVTPVNDIQIWLHCAAIWDKTYTTINQVLADTSTLLALISSNNAADYMARSTNWASNVCANQTAMGYIGNNNYCALKLLSNSTWNNAICNSTYFESILNVKVPTMTSDSTPYGTAFGTGIASGYPAYYSFDNSSSTRTRLSQTVNNNVGYSFPSNVIPKKATIHSSGSSSNSTRMKVQGKNTSNAWIDLTDNLLYPNGTQTVILNNLNNIECSQMRVILTAVDTAFGNTEIFAIQFYGRASS